MSNQNEKSIVSTLNSNAYSTIHNLPSQLDTTDKPNTKERKQLKFFVVILVVLILLFIFF